MFAVREVFKLHGLILDRYSGKVLKLSFSKNKKKHINSKISHFIFHNSLNLHSMVLLKVIHSGIRRSKFSQSDDYFQHYISIIKRNECVIKKTILIIIIIGLL